MFDSGPKRTLGESFLASLGERNEPIDAVVFPRAAARELKSPAWMDQNTPNIRPISFERPVAIEPAPPSEPAPPPPPPPPPDPFIEERAELAERAAQLDARSAELDAREAALEAEHARIGEAVQQVAAAADAFQAPDDASARQIAEIGVALARVLLEDAFEEAPERALAMARAARSQAEEGASLRIGSALHLALLEEGATLEAEVDPSLPPYGCVARGATYSMDAGLESRLRAALEALREAT